MTTDQILPLLVGPYGALVLAFVVIVGLYRLYQEERREGRKDRERMTSLADALKDLTHELREKQ